MIARAHIGHAFQAVALNKPLNKPLSNDFCCPGSRAVLCLSSSQLPTDTKLSAGGGNLAVRTHGLWCRVLPFVCPVEGLALAVKPGFVGQPILKLVRPIVAKLLKIQGFS